MKKGTISKLITIKLLLAFPVFLTIIMIGLISNVYLKIVCGVLGLIFSGFILSLYLRVNLALEEIGKMQAG